LLKGTFRLSLFFDEIHGHFDHFFYPATPVVEVFFEYFRPRLWLWRFSFLCLIRPSMSNHSTPAMVSPATAWTRRQLETLTGSCGHSCTGTVPVGSSRYRSAAGWSGANRAPRLIETGALPHHAWHLIASSVRSCLALSLRNSLPGAHKTPVYGHQRHACTIMPRLVNISGVIRSWPTCPTALMAKKDHDMFLLFCSIVQEDYSLHGQGHPVISI
jgi:hypothetical protein